MSGWKTATIKTDARRNKNLNIEINRKAEENENVKKLSDDSIGMWGYEADIKSEVADLLGEIEKKEGDKVLIIRANDTTDSGSGELYKFVELECGRIHLESVDEKIGYEGARARDVTGYFREEHGVNGFSHVH